jgi:hypothetical protein
MNDPKTQGNGFIFRGGELSWRFTELQHLQQASPPRSSAGWLGVGTDRPLSPLRPGLSGSATTTTINHVACAAGDVMGFMELQCSVLAYSLLLHTSPWFDEPRLSCSNY